jgi:5-methylcytosine-specific restriction enzyme subunit McrC
VRTRFYVRYQTYDRDIAVNRILCAALDALSSLSLSSGAIARAAACRAAFPDLGPARLGSDTFERIVLGRSTARYRDALVLARMILERDAPELRAGRVPVFAMLFDMNMLWERYVAALFRRAGVSELVVSTQESQRFWKPAGRPSRAVRPDIVARLTATGRAVLVVDTKWKVPPSGSPSDDDLRQMFVYNEILETPRALLVYPSVSPTAVEQAGVYEKRGHACSTVHLGLFDAKGWNSGGMKAQVKQLLDMAYASAQSA